MQARKVPACKMLGTVQMVWCFSRQEGVKRPFVPNAGREWGPKVPCWQGRRCCGPTRFGCGCHTVVLICTRDASFGAQLDEEESWTGMIAIMRHPLSSKSGAPRPLTAAHRAAQWSQALSQLTAYHSGTAGPHRVGQWFMKRDRDDRISQ